LDKHLRPHSASPRFASSDPYPGSRVRILPPPLTNSELHQAATALAERGGIDTALAIA